MTIVTAIYSNKGNDKALFLLCHRSKEWELIVSPLQPLHPGQWLQKHTRTCGQNFKNLYLQNRICKTIINII